jgi:arabinofuranosyltransferase
MSEPWRPTAGHVRAWSRQPGLWLATALYLAHAWWLAGLAEDAFISFRFARHLASGAGLTWNAGAPPVEGYTNFLWVLLEAACLRAGLDLVVVMPLAGVALGAVTLALVFRTLYGRLGCHALTATFAVTLLAVAGPFAAWASSGMETLLFTCLGWLAFDAVLAAQSRPGALLAGAGWLILASLTRPEGVLIAGLLLGGSFALRLAERRGPAPGDQAVVVFAYAGLFGAYWLWRWHYFGWPLPNTFYAKTGGGLEQWLRGTLLTGHFVFEFLLPLLPWTFLALWVAAVPHLSGIRAHLEARGRRRPVLIAGAVVGVYSAYVMAVGGDYMAMHRFFVVLLPFWYLLVACLVDPLVDALDARTGPRRAFGALVAWSLAATAVHSTPVDTLFFVRASQQHGNYQGVELERWHVARLSVIGRFFDRYRHGPDETLGTAAIGAIGYYADMPILDFHGLVDVHIAHEAVPESFGWHRPGHERHDYPYILDLKPTYLMFSRDLTPAPVSLERYLPREMAAPVRKRIEREYEPASAWLEDPDNRESGYFTFYKRKPDADIQPARP